MKNSKRILSVVIKRMGDESPDTSWLGEYSNKMGDSLFNIDRNHSNDCPRFWVNTDIPDDARECDCSEIPPHELPYFHPSSVEPYRENAEWIPNEIPIAERRAVWNESMHSNAKQNYKRMEAYNRGDFCFIGIQAKAEVWFPANGIYTTPGYAPSFHKTITSDGLYGIESDSDASYIEYVEQNALADLKAQLLALGFSKRAIATAFKTVERKEN